MSSRRGGTAKNLSWPLAFAVPWTDVGVSHLLLLSSHSGPPSYACSLSLMLPEAM